LLPRFENTFAEADDLSIEDYGAFFHGRVPSFTSIMGHLLVTFRQRGYEFGLLRPENCEEEGTSMVRTFYPPSNPSFFIQDSLAAMKNEAHRGEVHERAKIRLVSKRVGMFIVVFMLPTQRSFSCLEHVVPTVWRTSHRFCIFDHVWKRLRNFNTFCPFCTPSVVVLRQLPDWKEIFLFHMFFLKVFWHLVIPTSYPIGYIFYPIGYSCWEWTCYSQIFSHRISDLCLCPFFLNTLAAPWSFFNFTLWFLSSWGNSLPFPQSHSVLFFFISMSSSFHPFT
jgi:hypothetical protein